jgi:hypothetical protein
MAPKALFLALAISASIGGCATFKGKTPEQVIEAVQTEVPKAVEHSVAVTRCADFVQDMALDRGKRLSREAALAVCAALEASPDVVAPDTHT